MSEEGCEICGCAIEWILKDVEESVIYKVCSDCIIPLVSCSLSKEQFFNLIKSGHNNKEFLLHSDYYVNGIALQPADNPPQSKEKMIERIAKAMKGIDYREENDLDIAFKDLENAFKTDDETHIGFCKFGFWLALREIPIKLKENYMLMTYKNLDTTDTLEFKNINMRSYIFVDHRHLMIDYQDYYNFTYKLGDYAEKKKEMKK